jgi:hypothetical protein
MLTVLFAYSIDFKDVIEKLGPQQIVESINATVNAFDRCSERFDVFKVETKADSSYMVVAGIQDRSAPAPRRGSTTVSRLRACSYASTTRFSYVHVRRIVFSQFNTNELIRTRLSMFEHDDLTFDKINNCS